VKVEIQISHTEEILTTEAVMLQSLAYFRHGYTHLYVSETKNLSFFLWRRITNSSI